MHCWANSNWSHHLHPSDEELITIVHMCAAPSALQCNAHLPDAVITMSDHGRIILWSTELQRLGTFESLPHLEELSGAYRYMSLDTCFVQSSCAQLLVGTLTGELFALLNPPLWQDGGKGSRSEVKVRRIAQGHAAELWALATHPSQRIFVTGADDCTVRLWDMDTRRMVGVCFAGSPCRTVTFSPDGEIIGVGLRSGDIALLATKTLEETKVLRELSKPVLRLMFNADGTMLGASNLGSIGVFRNIHHEWRLVTTLQTGGNWFAVDLDWTIVVTAEQKLRAANEAGEIRCWTINGEAKEVEYSSLTSMLQQIEWRTQHCVTKEIARLVLPQDIRLLAMATSAAHGNLHAATTGDVAAAIHRRLLAIICSQPTFVHVTLASWP